MNDQALGSDGQRAMNVQVERGSVHASDDDTAREVAAHPQSTLRALVVLAAGDGFLPGISGGLATWVVEASDATGPGRRAVAVWAQQWAKPVFLVCPTTSVAAHFADTLPRLYFQYRCQIDPEAVLSALIAQQPPGATGSAHAAA